VELSRNCDAALSEKMQHPLWVGFRRSWQAEISQKQPVDGAIANE
jgi:hypothetical protein